MRQTRNESEYATTRYRPGRLRFGLLVLGIGLSFFWAVWWHLTGTLQWRLQDDYIATRITVTKAPYWADAQGPPDEDGAIAGWHIEARVGEYPFTVPMALADFDPDGIHTERKREPDSTRFAIGSKHPVWFYANGSALKPETIAYAAQAPTLIHNRVVYQRFPTFTEAVGESKVLILMLAAPIIAIGLFNVALAFARPRTREHASDGTLAVRIQLAVLFLLAALGTIYLANSHPLQGRDSWYIDNDFKVAGEPFPVDSLTMFAGVRIVWREWYVSGELAAYPGNIVAVPVDSVIAHRQPWSSRLSPDLSELKPGASMPVWLDKSSEFMLKGGSGTLAKPQRVQWDVVLSRERWPDKYTWRDFVREHPQVTAFSLSALLLALICLVPMPFARRE